MIDAGEPRSFLRPSVKAPLPCLSVKAPCLSVKAPCPSVKALAGGNGESNEGAEREGRQSA